MDATRRFCVGEEVIITLRQDEPDSEFNGREGVIKEVVYGHVYYHYSVILFANGRKSSSGTLMFLDKELSPNEDRQFLRRQRAQKATRVPMFPEEDPFS